MEPQKDAVSVRVGRLNAQLLGKQPKSKPNLTTRESLLDALQLLYDECNSDYLKTGDKNVSGFVDRYRRTLMELRQVRVNLSDFEVRSVIGRGHFGEVHVIKERQTGDVYAMKTVKKYENSEHKCAAFEEERNIMAIASSPWITKLQYAFQDNTNLYFVMEYHPGGDLLGLLHRQGGTLPESATTFYIAELVVAINDLHQMGFLHRDIKPDNVLLDRCGHLKLADFGSAAKLNAKGLLASGGIPVGTPDYIAPEALQSMDNKSSKINGTYGKPCDYWSLGILAYELTIGATPFTGLNTTATYSKIMNHTKTLKFPPDVLLTQSFTSFVRALLADHTVRLTHDQIVSHSLFKNVDFSGLRDQVPPYVPRISSTDDTSNFSDLQVKQKQPSIENFKSKTQFSGRNLPFVGFTYVTEPPDYREPYRASAAANDEIVEGLRKEVDGLQRKLLKTGDVSLEKEGILRKCEEKARKLETIERVRDGLEKDLASNIAECQALKRTLDLERRERTDLERKALEIIKSAKLKWEATEKIKLDNMSQQLEESKRKNAALGVEIVNLDSQLKEALKLTDKHKASLDNVEKLRRSSVIGLESRLEKVTTDTQNKVSTLQLQLSSETKKKSDLEKKVLELEEREQTLRQKLDVAEKNSCDLKNNCDEYKEIIAKLTTDLQEIEKLQYDAEVYEETVARLEEELDALRTDDEKDRALQRHAENNECLKKQIKDLKSELNTMRASKLSSVEDMKARNEAHSRELEAKLRSARMERDELSVRCQETEASLRSKEEKTGALEKLLNKLQDDLGRLECGSERESVLQEQVERLEKQLVDTSENAALGKQELVQLRSKYWRLSKDLTNADLDRKIVERDLRDQTARNKELQTEIVALHESIAATKRSNESAISELGEMNERLDSEVVKLNQKVAELKELSKAEKRTRDERDAKISELTKTIEKKELQICSVLKALDETKREKNLLSEDLARAQREREKLVGKVDDGLDEVNGLKNELEKYKTELENSLLNRKTLRDACTILDNQLTEFETIYDCSESKRRQLEEQVQTLNAALSEHTDDLQEVRKIANEEKSLKLLAETKCRRLSDDLENLQKELECYQTECAEFKGYSNTLAEELTAAEQKLSNCDVLIKSYERQIDDYVTENNYLKEENSEQLTFVNSLKESNYKLGQTISEYKANMKAMIGKINELESELNEKTHYFSERVLKADATMQQQTKLIDFLQSKIEDGNKKKKTLSDKLFGHSKKENVPPLSVVLNYKDLEFQLNKERDENKRLHLEISKLKGGTGKGGESVARNAHLQEEILSQLVQSPASQKNNLYRQNSVQRMHHNIPHRFDSKICTKPTKCVQCSNQILPGRTVNVCSECHIIAHVNCAQSLRSTCGLPTAYAKHYSDSLLKLNDTQKNQTQVGLETIDIEGWVKIPQGTSWEKHYACLTSSSLDIYLEPPNSENVKPLQSLCLYSPNEHGKVVLEPLAVEVGIPVANSDLPFVIKVEMSSNSTCWPSQQVVFMTLSVEDKDKWFKALYNIFHSEEKYLGEVVVQNVEQLDVNCLVELDNTAKLLGTETGLFSVKDNESLLHISGPLRVYEIVTITQINTALMLVDERRVLITCDVKHLTTLTQCAPCTKPTLKFKHLNVNNLDGFHMIRATNRHVCVATPKQVVILKYDLVRKEFTPQRVLDTAEPVGCMLFAEHSLIIGADKFFEVDLSSFVADEFLDASDAKVIGAVECYKLRSFPLSIVLVSRPPSPTEFLVCFNEFAIFVDEYGRNTRSSELSWTRVPTAVHFVRSYLYVVQFNAVEIFKITENTCNTTDYLPSFKLDLHSPRFLGINSNGIYVLSGKQIKHVNACMLDDDTSSVITSTVDQIEIISQSDRFSFTSSVMHSLDGQLSDTESDCVEEKDIVVKKVTFTKMTDL